MRFLLFYFLFVWLLFACSPRVIVSTLKEEVSLKDYEGFIIFNEDQEFDIPADELGKIEIKDSDPYL